jgi:hypothetical protein
VPISGLLPQNPAPAPHLADLIIEIGSEPPDWVHSAWKLTRAIHNGKSSAPGLPDAAYTVTAFGNDEIFELAYSDGTRFVVDGAAERMWATWLPPLTSNDLDVYLRGPVFGFVLQRRGVTVLHASAVNVEGHGVVLCGPSETGKSTTAAALALRGKAVLSDDLAALSIENGELQVEPGYPRICLWPEAVQSLLGSPDALPALTPNWEKRFLPLDGSSAEFQLQKCPLRLIYLLAPRVNDSGAPRVEGIGSRSALMELVQNTYMNWFLDRRQRAVEFHFLSRLVSQVPVRRIVSHADARRIGAVCDLILSDAKQILSRRGSAVALSSV